MYPFLAENIFLRNNDSAVLLDKDGREESEIAACDFSSVVVGNVCADF